jgi:hypothetical protein
MSKGKASGYVLNAKDAAIVRGMLARDDRDHDIAAWFGVNQGRIAEVKNKEKFPGVAAADPAVLPPKGAPGVKGRRLRDAVGAALEHLSKGDVDAATAVLKTAKANYDKHEA